MKKGRRKFLKAVAYNVLAYPLASSWLARQAQAATKNTITDISSTPFWGKAKTREDFEKDPTLRALIETVVPGKLTDPKGAPGSYECDVIKLLELNYFNVQNYLSLALGALNTLSMATHFKLFQDLETESREKILRNLEVRFAFFTLLTRFIRAPFYGADFSDAGTKFMKWPGANLGYVNDPTFSFKRPMAKERTIDGRMP